MTATKAANRTVRSDTSKKQAGKRSSALPVIEEKLQVRKRLVEEGGVRISKQVESREVVVDEVLRNERVEVERRPIGLRLEGDDIPKPRHEGDTWIVPVIEEVLVTEKRLVLVEEVRITRSQGTHHAPQRVTLRKEKVLVERLEPESLPAKDF